MRRVLSRRVREGSIPSQVFGRRPIRELVRDRKKDAGRIVRARSPRTLLACRPRLKDLLAKLLGRRLDILHDLSDPCSGGLVAPLGLGNVISG